MKLTVLDAENRPLDAFARIPLSDTHGEARLQQRLFENTDMLPLDAMRADTGWIIPICRDCR